MSSMHVVSIEAMYPRDASPQARYKPRCSLSYKLPERIRRCIAMQGGHIERTIYT